MSAKTIQRFFILGCERSGSTWLANLFDSHPDVELFMEPFADYAGLFPGFPGRNEYLEQSRPDLEGSVRTGYAGLPEMKYGFWYRPGRSPWLKCLDARYAAFSRKFRILLKQPPSSKVIRYQLLHLNTAAIPCFRQFRKNRYLSFEVTKEFRLNFKIALLAALFPDAKYLVILRHPGAQISSIMKLFAKQGLGELRRALSSFDECVRVHARFEKYRKALELISESRDMESKLILWWLINYEVLIEDLGRNGLDFQILDHETLSADPRTSVSKIFAFFGLNLAPESEDYIRLSMSGGHPVRSVVDTVRHSADYCRQAIDSVDTGLRLKIRNIFAAMEICPEIANRYGRSPRSL